MSHLASKIQVEYVKSTIKCNTSFFIQLNTRYEKFKEYVFETLNIKDYWLYLLVFSKFDDYERTGLIRFEFVVIENGEFADIR